MGSDQLEAKHFLIQGPEEILRHGEILDSFADYDLVDCVDPAERYGDQRDPMAPGQSQAKDLEVYD